MPFMRNRTGEQVYCSTSCQHEHRSKEYKQRDDILANIRAVGAANRDQLLGDYYAALRNDPCSMCGQRGNIEIDHIEPRSAGGANHWENYTALCAPCNRQKNCKSMLGYLGWKAAMEQFDSWRRFVGSDGRDRGYRTGGRLEAR